MAAEDKTCSLLCEHTASTPTNPNWVKTGSKETGQAKVSCDSLLPWLPPGSFLPPWLLPGSLLSPLLFSYFCCYVVFKVFYLLNFPTSAQTRFHARSHNSSHPTTAPRIPGASVQGPSRSCRETLARRELHPFHPRPNTTSYISPPFSCLCLCSLLLLLAHFGEACWQWDQSLLP